jgi:GNAT superfamily N-acetyltransferase
VASDYSIRSAVSADVETLIDFTLWEAADAEDAALDRDAAVRGVRAAFDDPPLARYFVAEATSGEIVASTSIVTEWSNFHGGHYWWIQSLFIVPAHRGTGLVHALLDHLAELARSSGALDLRLYAHESNERALRVYRRCGFTPAPYVIFTRDVTAR